MLLGGQIIGCLFLMNSREIFEVLYKLSDAAGKAR